MAKFRRDPSSGINDFQESKIEKQMEDGSKRNGLLVALPHFIALFFVATVIWIAKPTSSSVFPWHPTLMSLAFMLFMPEGILAFSRWFSLMPTLSKDNKITLHRVFQVTATACAYTGLAAITYTKYSYKEAHYTSWHGMLGIIVCGTLVIQASGGIIQVNPSILPFAVPKVLIKRLHAFSGSVTFSVAMVTMILALYSNWLNIDSMYLWGALCICPIVMLSAVFFQFIKNHIL